MRGPVYKDTDWIRRKEIVASLKDKENREVLVEESISVGLPLQIHELRKRAGWTQKKLGDLSGQAQTRISLLEKIGYDAFTVKTLTKIAAAFDVALIVKFAPFSDLVDRMTNLSSEDVLVPKYDDDPGLDPLANHNVVALVETASALQAANLRRAKLRKPAPRTAREALDASPQTFGSIEGEGREYGTSVNQSGKSSLAISGNRLESSWNVRNSHTG